MGTTWVNQADGWKVTKKERRKVFWRWRLKMWLLCWYYEVWGRVEEIFTCGNPHKRFGKLALACRRRNRRMWKFRVASNIKLACWLVPKLEDFWDRADNDRHFDAIGYWFVGR